VHVTASVETGILLGQFRGDLRQGLCRGDADADGDPDVAADGASDCSAEPVERFGHAAQVEKGLVDRVDLDTRDQRAERGHHAARQVSVEGEVGREDRNLPLLDERPDLIEGLPHADAEGLGLVRAGDDAAVVVRQHDDGPPHKIGPEYPLAGGVEVVAVAESVHRGRLFEGFDDMADNAPDEKLVARIDADRPVAGIRGHEPGAPLFEPYALYGRCSIRRCSRRRVRSNGPR